MKIDEEGSAALRSVVDAILDELPLDDLTSHVIDCGYDANDQRCGCYTLPARIAAAITRADRSPEQP